MRAVRFGSRVCVYLENIMMCGLADDMHTVILTLTGGVAPVSIHFDEKDVARMAFEAVSTAMEKS